PGRPGEWISGPGDGDRGPAADAGHCASSARSWRVPLRRRASHRWSGPSHRRGVDGYRRWHHRGHGPRPALSGGQVQEFLSPWNGTGGAAYNLVQLGAELGQADRDDAALIDLLMQLASRNPP